MEKDFIPLHDGKCRANKKEQSDIYQDYIDNIDEEYKYDLDGFVTLSIGEDQLDSYSDSDSIHSEIYKETGISKSKIRKAKKEARRLRKDIAMQDSQTRNDNATELAKILSKSKGFMDKSVVEYLKRENVRMLDFIRSNQDSMVLGTMPSAIRDLIQEIADRHHLTTKTRGRAKNKVFVLLKNSGSRIAENATKVVEEITKGRIGTNLNINKFWYGSLKVQKKKVVGAPNKDNVPKMGDVVGGSAPPLNSDSSIGHAMLLKMGWKPGNSLGDGTGIVEPITAVVRSKRGGLGAE